MLQPRQGRILAQMAARGAHRDAALPVGAVLLGPSVLQQHRARRLIAVRAVAARRRATPGKNELDEAVRLPGGKLPDPLAQLREMLKPDPQARTAFRPP